MFRQKQIPVCAFFLLVPALVAAPAVAQRSWDGGNGTDVWGDFGNWSPDGDPNGVAISIGNLAGGVNATTRLNNTFSINSLTITNGADVINSTDDGATNDFRLLVNGLTTISDPGSTITIYGGDPEGLDTDNLTINSGATVSLNSQTAQGNAILQVDGGTGTGLLDINTGGTLSGNGLIQLIAAPAAPTVLLSNDGTLTARAFGPLLFPPATTLQIPATDPDARVDLDGVVGNGVVNTFGNATLDIGVAINDAFSGTINMSAGSALDIAGPWSIDLGTVNINTPGVIFGSKGAAAHLAGGAITMTGGTINLDDIDSVVLDAALTTTGGTINNAGSITVNSVSTVGAGTDFNMTGGEAQLTVNGIFTVNTPDFNLDGSELAGNTTTVNAGAALNLNLGAGADLSYGHTINLNGGAFGLSTSAATAWTLNSNGTVNAAGGTTSTIASPGETFQIGGHVNVTANSTLNVNSVSEYLSTAGVVIDGGSTLNHNGAVTYNGGSYAGGGVLSPGTATIAAATTWNVATVNLDDGNLILNDLLTVNANSIDNSGDGFDTAVTIADAAGLAVNIGGGGSWAVDATGSITYNGNASINNYLLGSDIHMFGTINHNGDGRTNARLDIGSTGVININTAGEPLRLNGGNDTTNPNTIAGGTIQGPGILAADGGKALHGFGTISTTVDFPSASLRADNGILSLTGTITSVRNLGTADSDGNLNVTNPWNTNSTVTVGLAGGELRGAVITNGGVAGINGHGLVSARVLNDTRIDAEGGGTLVVETAANNNDWDGAGAGQLNAISADLEIRDNAAFLFTGTVGVSTGRTVFANGFELEFDPGSTLSLASGAHYRSTNATDIGGNVSVTAGTAFLDNGGTTVFENGSATTLTGNLQLNNPTTTIQAGATFSGGGRLINSVTRTLRPLDGANVGVLIENQGTLEIGASHGQATGLDFQQNPSGALHIELQGTGLAQFDRLTFTGAAQLAGNVNVSLLGGFAPALGNMFNFVSATGGISGNFDSLTQPAGMPAGLFFGLAYQATFAQLVVIDHLPGDYNKNGVVDAADYVVWRDTAGDVVSALGGADGNGNGVIDAGDYNFWRGHFGDTAAGSGSGAATSVAVPEPKTFLLLTIGVIGIQIRRLRSAKPIWPRCDISRLPGALSYLVRDCRVVSVAAISVLLVGRFRRLRCKFVCLCGARF
jgi:hypothetical protein